MQLHEALLYWSDVILRILLSIVLGLAIPYLIKLSQKYISFTKSQEDKNEIFSDNLKKVASSLECIEQDMQALYALILPLLDSMEVSLEALKGEKINGNVDETLRELRARKMELVKKMSSKIDYSCKDR